MAISSVYAFDSSTRHVVSPSSRSTSSWYFNKELLCPTEMNDVSDKDFNKEYICFSFFESSALVASSRIATGGLASKTRANARRCCSPNDKILLQSPVESSGFPVRISSVRVSKYPKFTFSKVCFSNSSLGGTGHPKTPQTYSSERLRVLSDCLPVSPLSPLFSSPWSYFLTHVGYSSCCR